jgi:hypothetical protein
MAEEGGYLFSKHPPISIRRGLPVALDAPQSPRFQLPIRVLMVISRPDVGTGGVTPPLLDPRSSAQALLDALDELGDAVQVDFLRPPTMQALDDTLARVTYPIVHFDGHGVYDRVKGLGQLLFERGDHSLDEVDAQRIGTLLNQRNIPLVILDACQTAVQGTREFTSVASKLIEAGVGSVLAMNYSVLVPTTRKFSTAFYRALAQGQTISVATEHARRALLNDTFRFKLIRGDKDERVSLHDWFLPALYQRAQDPALFATTGCRLPTTHRRAASAVCRRLSQSSPRAADSPTRRRRDFTGAPANCSNSNG